MEAIRSLRPASLERLRGVVARPAPTARPQEGATPALLPTVSGGPGSLLPFSGLGKDEQEFLLQTTPKEKMTALFGGAAQDPIRVAAGLSHGASPEERARMTVAEGRRLGAFDRALLILEGQAGRTVDRTPISAAEYFGRGDVATLTAQYSSQSSIVTVVTGGVKRGATAFELLLRFTNEELDRRKKAGLSVPKLALYGESLGAWTPEDVAVREPLARLLSPKGRHRFDVALFTGTPGFSKFKHRYLEDRHQAAGGKVRQFDGRADLAAAGDTSKTRVYLLSHPDDPVVRVDWRLIWHRPKDWTPGVRWLPGLTFAWQIVKLPFAIASSLSGKFGDREHDYSLDIPYFVRRAFGFPGVTDAQVAEVIAELEALKTQARETLL